MPGFQSFPLAIAGSPGISGPPGLSDPSGSYGLRIPDYGLLYYAGPPVLNGPTPYFPHAPSPPAPLPVLPTTEVEDETTQAADLLTILPWLKDILNDNGILNLPSGL